MSSYIFNSNQHRHYVVGSLALVLTFMVGLFCLGIYLQPLSGDLTRVGAYAEKDFGWNKPQLEFQKSLFVIGAFDNYYDVVVLGDSFSTSKPNLGWQNYLAATKGWTVTTLNIETTKLQQILDNPVFKQNPPKYFIFETVEREFNRRIENEQPCEASPSNHQAAITAKTLSVRSSIDLKELQGITKYVERKTAWSDIKLGFVRDYLWNSLLRPLIGSTHTGVAQVNLVRNAPFSSINKQSMLVFKDDLKKVPEWHRLSLQETSCRIEKIRKQVEANGRTRFILMVAPNKLTAYTDFIGDKSLQKASILSALSEYLPEITPRIDLALTTAINKGEQDVYLPDDTHWGSSGYQIAAETLMTFLNNP